MRTRTQPERVTTAAVEDTANGPVLVYKALGRVPDAIIDPDRLLHMKYEEHLNHKKTTFDVWRDIREYAENQRELLSHGRVLEADRVSEREMRDLQHVIDLCAQHAEENYQASKRALLAHIRKQGIAVSETDTDYCYSR